MGFVVTRAEGTDDEFLEYRRLLRKRKVDLGRAPRARDPFSGLRWLYVWDAFDHAREFLDTVIASTEKTDWEIVEAESVGIGQLGPIVILLARRGRDFSLGVEIVSKSIIQSVYPDAIASLTYGELRADDWAAFQQRKGKMADLIRLIAPHLCGLDNRQLESLGYVVIDDVTRETVLSVPPNDLTQVDNGIAQTEPSLASA